MIVLFGATGDLAKRKLLPGMFHLARVGLMPERFRIIGAARRADRGRGVPRAGPRVGRGLGPQVARRRTPGSASPSRCASPASATASSALGRGDRGRARGARRRGRRPLLPLAAAAAPPPARSSRSARSGSARGARVITEKPFGTDLASARELNAPAARGLRRALHLPDRPLPRPRGGAEPAGAALRQRHVRAGLEPQPHRPRPDRRPRDALDRDARQLLRGNGRLPRHGRHPPVPGARLRRDGAADLARPETARARAREGLRLDAAARPGRRRPRPVRRLPRGGRGRRRLRHRDLRRGQGLRRQLALGGRAVLPALGQAPGREQATC